MFLNLIKSLHNVLVSGSVSDVEMIIEVLKVVPLLPSDRCLLHVVRWPLLFNSECSSSMDVTDESFMTDN